MEERGVQKIQMFVKFIYNIQLVTNICIIYLFIINYIFSYYLL